MTFGVTPTLSRPLAGLALAAVAITGCSSQSAPQTPTIPQVGTGLAPGQCTQVDPAKDPKPPLPTAEQPEGCERPGICIGQPAPNWQAYDFQPRSCGYGQKYGMANFTGKVTLLVHLAGWCSYCQLQTIKLEKLRLELGSLGHQVNLAIVNAKNADNDKDRKALVDNCSFSVFQDHQDFEIWSKNGGSKDDMYIYDPQGKLLEYLPHSAGNTNLSDDTKYQALRDKLVNYATSLGKTPGANPGAGTGTGTEGALSTSATSTSTSP